MLNGSLPAWLSAAEINSYYMATTEMNARVYKADQQMHGFLNIVFVQPITVHVS